MTTNTLSLVERLVRMGHERATSHLCSRDGQPCYVGADTDDAHYRCGTVQCGFKSASVLSKEQQ